MNFISTFVGFANSLETEGFKCQPMHKPGNAWHFTLDNRRLSARKAELFKCLSERHLFSHYVISLLRNWENELVLSSAELARSAEQDKSTKQWEAVK